MITVLITNYNTSEYVDLSLEALKKLTVNEYRVLINDNGSTENDIAKLREIEEKYENVQVNYRKSKFKEASYAHAEALDLLIDKVDSKYFLVLDSDCVVLKKGWDNICISSIDDKVKIIGTQIASLKGLGHKPNDFPFQFCVFLETETYKKLNISCMPENTTNKDTCWQWRNKYLNAGYKSKLFYAKNTKEYRTGPFKDVYCAEYYDDNDALICNHFGRGSSGGFAKYSDKWWFRIPVVSKLVRYIIAKNEKKTWIKICKEIINLECEQK